MICLSFKYFRLTEIYIQIWNKNDKLLDVFNGWLLQNWSYTGGEEQYKEKKLYLIKNFRGFVCLYINTVNLFESRNRSWSWPQWRVTARLQVQRCHQNSFTRIRRNRQTQSAREDKVEDLECSHLQDCMDAYTSVHAMFLVKTKLWQTK